MVVDDETDMEDEYGDMNDSGLTYTTDELKLECGEKLIQPQLRYRSWGKLNEAKDNVKYIYRYYHSWLIVLLAAETKI